MSARARMRVTVTSTRGASQVTVSTQGRYVSLNTNDISTYLAGQAIQPTASSKAFWQSVLTIVQGYLATLP